MIRYGDWAAAYLGVPRVTATERSIAESIRDAAVGLADAGSATPRLDAEVLIRHLLGLNRTGLFIRLRDPIDERTHEAYTALVERRIAGEPVAFLTGVREFMGLSFAVGPGVLVPRPETELLVEWAAEWLAGKSSATVIDVGTGSGAIALSLATLRRDDSIRIVGGDRSIDALRYAVTNRASLGLTRNVEFVVGDLTTWCRPPVDLVLANLPYLRPDQLASNPDLRAEPEAALVSGVDGLDAIRRTIVDLPRLLRRGGAAGFEIDPSQVAAMHEAIALTLPGAQTQVLVDLAGFQRMVIVQRGDES